MQKILGIRSVLGAKLKTAAKVSFVFTISKKLI